MADIQIYGAPWCGDCRRTRRFLNELRVDYDWIDIQQDESGASLVREKNDGKQIIPTLVFPDGSHLTEPSNAELAAKLGLRVQAERQYYDLIIVGCGPAGLTTGIFAAREGIDTLMLERSGFGGQAMNTERIDNYPGFPEGIRGMEIANRMIEQAERYGVEMLSAVSVKQIYRNRRGDIVVAGDTGDEYRARAVVIATGSTYRKLGVPGEDEFIGSGLHYCATCDGPFYKGSENLLVVGGGNSGVEEALFLTEFTDKVTIIEKDSELRAGALLREKAAFHAKVEVLTETRVAEFKGASRVEGVVLQKMSSEETWEVRPQGVFVFVGQTPNSRFVANEVETDELGFIKTDSTLQTSVPGVFAAGDVRAGSTKQLASAVGEGASVLLMVRHYLRELGELGTHSAVLA